MAIFLKLEDRIEYLFEYWKMSFDNSFGKLEKKLHMFKNTSENALLPSLLN